MASVQWQLHTDAALAWLRSSISACEGRGSAHSWSPIFGWNRAYPETTGYLIETMYRFDEYERAGHPQEPTMESLALRCTDWLCQLQLPNGAFPGLLAGHTQPSIFNSAQILFGLCKTYELHPDLPQKHQLYKAIQRCANWLTDAMDADGAWRQAAYVKNFTPTYYTRALWGLLKANEILQNSRTTTRCEEALYFYATRFQENGSIEDWGFWPQKPAFTHTLAYTLEGFLECAQALQRPDILAKTRHSSDMFLASFRRDGRAGGWYDQHWKANHRFVCPVGNCQLSVVFFRWFECTGEQAYRSAAFSLLDAALAHQVLKTRHWNRTAYGALPGSAPFWGPYLRGRYPNWGVKFLLDALWYAQKQDVQ